MSLMQKITSVQIAGAWLLVTMLGKMTPVELKGLTLELVDRREYPDGVFLAQKDGHAVISAKTMAEIQILFRQSGIEKLPGKLPCPDKQEHTFCYACGSGCIVNQLKVA